MLPTDLIYSEQRPGKKPSQKGCIELSRIKCVEIVCSEVPIPYSNKYPFQNLHNWWLAKSFFAPLYIFAPDNDFRQRWVRALKKETKCNALLLKYYPNFWMEGRWRCCYQTEKMATGCQEYDSMGYSTHFLAAFPSLCIVEARSSDAALHNFPSWSNSPYTAWRCGKEGAFVVRDSRHAGVYTVSVFTKAPG
uniref:Uncharacterized protein n=1 Tax=Oncorhynchus tshawytscha TaxID=74940 RepID=A0A8C8IGH4_ONCTS